MAKYICDFDVVSSVGQELIEKGNDLKTATANYSSVISSNLSGWNGSAKDSFVSQSTSKKDEIIKKADYMIQFGEFIKLASKSIQDLEDSLSSQSI